tara:strand:- start:266 stop:547 length:282 start_codon:yes stop_codon:yes gene_type:complete
MDIKALKTFLDSVETLAPMISINDCDAWYKVETEFCWAKNDEIYSGESTEGFEEDDDWLIVNLDGGCEVTTGLFDKSKELTESGFYDLYEEFM